VTAASASLAVAHCPPLPTDGAPLILSAFNGSVAATNQGSTHMIRSFSSRSHDTHQLPYPMRPGAPGCDFLLGRGVLCAFLGFGRTLLLAGTLLRGDPVRRDVRALFRSGGGFVVGFCVRHVNHPFSARASRMTIHRSCWEKHQVKSFSESNDYGVRDGSEIGNFVGSGAFLVDSTKP